MTVLTYLIGFFSGAWFENTYNRLPESRCKRCQKMVKSKPLLGTLHLCK